jgi:hypothetical protein
LDNHLHIIAFDVPYPADYGGAIDVFYRIKALHRLGVKIHLHCYEYGRGMPEELKDYVEEIQYYRRRKSVIDWFNKLPFIVKTRSSKFLIRNLLKDDAPILFEGIHTTFLIRDERLKKRKKIVRAHNIEHEYYSKLAEQASGVRRRFFRSEAKKLLAYEPILKHADHILAIKQSDADHLKQYCPSTTVLPASLPEIGRSPFDTTRPFFLFHGNLSVAENETGAIWLIENVFGQIEWCDKLLIAGKNPTQRLKDVCQQYGVMLTPNPDDQEMNTLIWLARVHVIYSEQSTGVKLKLINALRSNGHVIVNPNIVKGTDFADLCTVALDTKDYIEYCKSFISIEVSPNEIIARQTFIEANLDTDANCKRILLPLIK